MTPDQTTEFLTRARRTFAAVNEALAKPSDPAHQIAWQVRLESWRHTLADVPAEDAARALDAIHRGDAGDDLRYPNDWRDRFPATVRRWCRQNKALTITQQAPRGPEHEIRYRCLTCRDTGYVTAINGDYAAEHRHLVEGPTPVVSQDEALDERNAELMRRLLAWRSAAKLWCRLNGSGAFIATCVCHCENRVAIARRAAIQERLTTGCVYQPKRMPLVVAEDSFSVWEAFETFVHGVTVEDGYSWNPSQPVLGYTE